MGVTSYFNAAVYVTDGFFFCTCVSVYNFSDANDVLYCYLLYIYTMESDCLTRLD